MRDDEQSGDNDPEIDLSMTAVNERLRSFVGEVRAAEARGEHGSFAASDKLLAKMCENALAYQEKAALDRAEVERRMLAQRGERLQ